MFAPDAGDRTVPIQNGIDVQQFLNHSEERFELPEAFAQRPKVLNVGAFEYKKGHDVLLETFALLAQTHPDAGLIIAGQAMGLYEQTRDLVKQMDLEKDVLLYRDLPHSTVAGLLRSCDVFVLSSRWEKGRCGEGLAMVLLEAAAAGKPVVSTLSCGVSELIKDGETGWVVPPGDPKALAAALRDALDHPAEASRRARNLHDLVRRDFTWKKAHASYSSVLCASLR